MNGERVSTLDATPKVYRNKTMADKSMYIPNKDTQNYPFSGLKSLVETFENST